MMEKPQVSFQGQQRPAPPPTTPKVEIGVFGHIETSPADTRRPVASDSLAGAAKRAAHPKAFRGVRMRSWGKWVSEIRQPKKRSRIWLGSYSTPEAAAIAYDMALYYLRGPLAALNFPAGIPTHDPPPDVSPQEVQKAAVAAGLAADKGRFSFSPPLSASSSSSSAPPNSSAPPSGIFLNLNALPGGDPQPEASGTAPSPAESHGARPGRCQHGTRPAGKGAPQRCCLNLNEVATDPDAGSGFPDENENIRGKQCQHRGPNPQSFNLNHG